MMLKIGDVVRVKGQTVVMTVVQAPVTSSLHHEDCVRCLWYDTRNRLQHETFLVELLEKTLAGSGHP